MSKKDQLLNMSRDEKLKQLELMREKKRRIKKKKPQYVPNPGQLAFHMDSKPIVYNTSANAAGKTTSLVQEVWWAATGYSPIREEFTKVPATIVVLIDNVRKISQVWLPALNEWFDLENVKQVRAGKPYISELHFPNGSIVYFMTHDLDMMVFEGIELDVFLADEPFARPIWVALTRGLRKKGTVPKVKLVGTPIAHAWMYKELWRAAERGERDDIGLHRMGVEVNRENLAEGYIEQFSKNLSEKEKQARLKGHPIQLDGLALAHLFDPETHEVEAFDWPETWPVVVAIDPHPSKKHVACMVGVDRDGQLYYIKEIASSEAPRAFAQTLRQWMSGFRVLDIVCDSLGAAPTTGGDGNMSFIEVLNSEGVRARSTTYKDKDDEAFIDKIRQVLEVPEHTDNFGRRRPPLLIFAGNRMIVNDIENVTWLRHKTADQNKPKLDISDKDALATLKYALATDVGKFKNGKPRTKKSKPSPWSSKKKRRML